MYAEGASLHPQDGIIDSLDHLEASHDPLFGLYDAGTRTRTRTAANIHTALTSWLSIDSAESPQLFQPLHPQSVSPTFALDDEEAESPAPARRGTGGSGGRIRG